MNMLAAIEWSLKFGHKHAEQIRQTAETVQTQTQDTNMLAALIAFFAVGELGFWLLLLALSVIYTIATEKDTHVFAIIATIVGVALLWTPIKEVFTHWQLLVVGVFAYGLAGGAWSVFRWFKYCRKYIETHPYSPRTYRSNASMETPEEFYSNQLKPSDHKSRLISWIIYWPWSLVWNICGDFFTGIYDMLANIYTKVSQTVIKKATIGISVDPSKK